MTKSVVIDGVEYVPKQGRDVFVGEIKGLQHVATAHPQFPQSCCNFTHTYATTIALIDGNEITVELTEKQYTKVKEAFEQCRR